MAKQDLTVSGPHVARDGTSSWLCKTSDKLPEASLSLNQSLLIQRLAMLLNFCTRFHLAGVDQCEGELVTSRKPCKTNDVFYLTMGTSAESTD